MKNRSQLRTKTQVAWRADSPFNELPPLPPPIDLETKAILKACILARAALAELKQAAERIPNQGMLINTMPLLEAQASSEIENIVTTSDRLFQYHHDTEAAAPATKEALWYSQSLFDGYHSLTDRPLTTRAGHASVEMVGSVYQSP